jgi:hypothetical protein
MTRSLLSAAALLAFLQTPSVVEHRDPQGRFRLTHPRSYGTASPGTNDGFGGRFAAVRFSSFPAVLGGELVLTTGFPFVDLQALGGLYDSIALEVFPDPLRRRIVAQLPRLTPANFCSALGRVVHLDVDSPALSGFTIDQRAAIRRVDQIRSIKPVVVRCALTDGVITFDRETSFQERGPRQHIFGAIRFLDGEISSVQLVAGAPLPRAGVIDEIATLVRSVVVRN